jgi:transcriptional regulator with XRE-family HTH domain
MRQHERLAGAIDARRLQLGLSWVQLSEASGVSDVTLRNIRRGRSEPNALTAHKIETALGWAPGSVEALYEGGQATPAAQLREQYPEAYARGYEAAQRLDDGALSAVLRSVDDALLLAELARRLQDRRESSHRAGQDPKRNEP